MVDQHGASSDKQLDAMKQKMMKLRKVNEVLRRQLIASDVHAKVQITFVSATLYLVFLGGKERGSKMMNASVDMLLIYVFLFFFNL